MNTIANIIAVKYPRNATDGKKSNVVSLTDKSQIKPTITNLLFNQSYDYCVIYYINELFITEKDSPTTYTRRQIIYHPLSSSVYIKP